MWFELEWHVCYDVFSTEFVKVNEKKIYLPTYIRLHIAF